MDGVSERDLHQAFAEAVAAGKLASSSMPEMTLGLHPLPISSSSKNPLPAMFTHLLQERQDISPDTKNLDISLRQRILSASRDADEQLRQLCQAFSIYLTTAVQLPVEAMNIDTAIIDLGVDSLVAMDIRAWFMREVHVDVTVLQILGGASINECQFFFACLFLQCS
jgi:hybrid polyketide synthase / nonribosomal peptide synthetase ACE1